MSRMYEHHSTVTKHTKFVIDPEGRTWDVMTYDDDHGIKVRRWEGKTVMHQWVPVVNSEVIWRERSTTGDGSHVR